MARSGPDALVKRNNKLEAFLKRNLDEDVFERIRTHEACIEEKAYKYVIISDEWIYLTENPPKKLTPCVHFADVVKIELVNEFPDFLQGEERENTQHIAIHFLTNEPPKGRRRRNSSKRSARSTRTASLANSGLLLTRDDRRKSFDDRLALSTSRTLGQSTARFSRQSSYSPTRRSTIAAGSETLRSESTTPRFRSKSIHTDLSSSMRVSNNNNNTDPDNDENETNGENETKSKLSKKDSKKDSKKERKKERKPSRKDSKDSETSTEGNSGKENDPVNGISRQNSKSRQKLSKTQSSSLDVPTITVDDFSEELRLNLEELDNEEDGSIFTSSKSKKKKQQSITFREGDNMKKDLQNEKMATPKKTKKKRGLPCFSKEPTIIEHKISDFTDDGIWEGEEWRKEVLHLYVVSISSPLLILTRFAWSNYLIRATLELDEEYFRKTNRIKRSPGEKMNQLYNELKGEILDSNNNMEATLELMLELKTAAERNFTLRKLFWKTPEMYAFIVKQLKTYLPDPPKAKTEEEERVDQIEYVMLLADVLCVMLRETEVIPSRIHCIRISGAKVFQSLLTALTCTPSTPQQTPTATIEEFTNVATQLLHELLLVAHQASMEDDLNSFLNIHNMMKIISDLSFTEEYVNRCLLQVVQILSPSERYRLPASSAVLLFYQFTFLNRLLEYSPKTIDFIRNNFYEEFKYYIQGPIIEAKLPKVYPISPYVVKEIQTMMQSVLQKDIDLGLEPYYGRYNLF